jgi:hypothetical protein
LIKYDHPQKPGDVTIQPHPLPKNPTVPVEVLKKILSDNAWLAGTNPHDGQNPWQFNADGTFKTLKDGQHGTYNVWMANGKPAVTLEWKSTKGWAEFHLTENKDKHIRLDWVKGGWEWMKGWHIVNKGWNVGGTQKPQPAPVNPHPVESDIIQKVNELMTKNEWLAGENPSDG